MKSEGKQQEKEYFFSNDSFIFLDEFKP